MRDIAAVTNRHLSVGNRGLAVKGRLKDPFSNNIPIKAANG